MDSKHRMLLRNIFDVGSIRVDQTIESQSLLDELIRAGLVEIVPAASTCTDIHGGFAEYRLTEHGKAIAQSLQPQ